jgi:hypothetical protein
MSLADPLNSALDVLTRHNLQLRDIVHLDAQDLRDLGLDLSQRIALRISLSDTQDFTFVVSHFNSTRQWGKCLNIIVKYRYLPGTTANSTGGGYLDYREMRKLALVLAQPTQDYPMNVQWEAVNHALVDEILLRYGSQITAVSSQMQVLHEMNLYIDEPGNHGSIVTVGDISPNNEPWINAFRYDCTQEPGPGAIKARVEETNK